MLIINWNGLRMFAGGFSIAIILGYIFGFSSEGALMIVGGPVIAIIDLAYRFKLGKGQLWNSDKGGHLFFIPAWCLGLLWFILGIIYVTKGS